MMETSRRTVPYGALQAARHVEFFVRGCAPQLHLVSCSVKMRLEDVARVCGACRGKGNAWFVVGRRVLWDGRQTLEQARLARHATLDIRLRVLGGAEKKGSEGLLADARALAEQDRHNEALMKYKAAVDAAKREGDTDTVADGCLEAGFLLLEVGCDREAIPQFEAFLGVAKQVKEEQWEGMAYGNLGNVYDSLGEYQRALEYHKKHLAIAQRTGDESAEGSAYGNLGSVYDSLGEYRRALEYHKKHLAIAQRTGDESGESEACSGIGNAYDSLGEYQRALEYHKKDLAIAQRIGDLSGEGGAYGNIGNVYDSLGEYQRALEYHEKDLAIAQRIGDVSGEARAYGNLGNVYDSIGEYQRALEYHKKHLAIVQRTGDVSGEGATYGNIGIVYYRLGEYQRALENHKKHLSIAQRIGDVSGEGAAYSGIGNAYARLGEYQRALDCLRKRVAIAQRIDDVKGEGGAYGNIGNVYDRLGEYQRALEYHEKNLAIAQRTGDVSGEGGAYGNIGNAYNSLGEYERALEHYEKHLAIAQQTGDVSGEQSARSNIVLAREKLDKSHKDPDKTLPRSDTMANTLLNDRCGKLWSACRSGNVDTLTKMRSDTGIKNHIELIDAHNDDNGDTALHYAARSGHLEAVQHLVEEWGAILDAENASFETAYQEAVLAGHMKVARYLRERGASPFLPLPVFQRVEEKRFAVPSVHGSELLRLAWNGEFNKRVAGIEDSRGIDPFGRTTLHLAAYRGHADYVHAAVQRERQHVDPTLPDNEGWTALHWACARKGLDKAAEEQAVRVCGVLIDSCPELLAKRTNRGETARDIARKMGLSRVDDFLRDKGAHRTTMWRSVPRRLEYAAVVLCRGLYFPGRALAHAISGHSTSSILRGDSVHRIAAGLGTTVIIGLVALCLLATLLFVPDATKDSVEDGREEALFWLAVVFGVQLLFLIWNVFSASRSRNFLMVKHERERLRFGWKKKTESAGDVELNGNSEGPEDPVRARSVNNALELLGIVISFVSLQSYAFLPDNLRGFSADLLPSELRGLSDAFSVGVLNFGANAFRVAFWSVVGLALAWFALSSYLLMALRILRTEPGSWLRKRYAFVHEDFFARLPASEVLIPLLSDTLFLPIVTKLVQGLDCTHRNVPEAVLDAERSIVCWRGEHIAIASVALVVAMYYLVTSSLISVYFSEPPDDSTDVRTIPVFLVASRALEWIQAVVGTFFSEYGSVAVGSSLAVSGTLALLTWRWKPTRRVWSVNHWRLGSYVAIFWSGVCSLVALLLEDSGNVAPFWMFVGGWAVILGRFGLRHWMRGRTVT